MNDRLAFRHILDARPVFGRVSAICVVLGRLSDARSVAGRYLDIHSVLGRLPYARRLENVQISPGNGGSVRIAPDNGTSLRIAPDNRASVKYRPRSRALGGASGDPVRAVRRNERRRATRRRHLRTASILKMWISAGCQGASEVLLAIRPADAYHSDRIARLLSVIRRAATASAVR